MEVYRQAVRVEAAESLGGYAAKRTSDAPSEALEVNGWSFRDPESGLQVEACSLDVLYAGRLLDRVASTHRRWLFAASHTHFAPMLDATKPLLGDLAPRSLDAFEQAVLHAERKAVAPDTCRIYRAPVSIPVYRRFDVPDSRLNRLLTAFGGMYPNERQPVDRNVYAFVFERGSVPEFVLLHHACHPVTRSRVDAVSADYVAALREGARARFGDVPTLFLLGCTGDVRPNLARKRVRWLPRSRVNWRFEPRVTISEQQRVDREYRAALDRAELFRSIPLGDDPVRLEPSSIRLRAQGRVETPRLVVGGALRFEFVPFEVSHLFHLEAQRRDPLYFLVSCANATRGYLPHPSQLRARGYEVDGSRRYMGLDDRAVLDLGFDP